MTISWIQVPTHQGYVVFEVVRLQIASFSSDCRLNFKWIQVYSLRLIINFINGSFAFSLG